MQLSKQTFILAMKIPTFSAKLIVCKQNREYFESLDLKNPFLSVITHVPVPQCSETDNILPGNNFSIRCSDFAKIVKNGKTILFLAAKNISKLAKSL